MEQRTLALPAILICTLLSLRKAEADALPPTVVVPVPMPAQVPAPAAPAPDPLPAPAVPATGAEKPASKLPAAKTPVEAALRHVVMLERNGRPLAIGTPLNGDGRILTALSPLTHGNQIFARYPEGQLIPVKLSHVDRAWDLALLTPEGNASPAGLKASREPAPSVGTKVHALIHVKDKQLGSSSIAIKGKGTLRGGDSAELPDAFELPFAPKPTDVGAPLLNDQGDVVAIVARACAVTNKLGCTLAPYAAQVSAVRDFLRAAPVRRAAWLGLEVVAFEAFGTRGVRVASVAPEGPALSAGLRAGPAGVGDVVLAVDGKPVATAAAFAGAIDNRGSSAPARLTVFSEGRYREVLLLVPAPAATPALAPSRSDRVYHSNPSGAAPPPQYRHRCRTPIAETSRKAREQAQANVGAGVKVTNSRKSLTEGWKASDDRSSPCPGSVRLFHGMCA